MTELPRNLAAIAAANNTGAIQLDQQDYQGAIQHFTRALRSAETMIHHHQQDTPAISEEIASPQHPFGSRASAVLSTTSHSSIDDWMEEEEMASDYSFLDAIGPFVYNQVIMIPPTMDDVLLPDGDEEHVSDNWLNLSCIAIVFNMSLA
jgi:hypothetical protein